MNFGVLEHELPCNEPGCDANCRCYVCYTCCGCEACVNGNNNENAYEEDDPISDLADELEEKLVRSKG